MCWGYRFSLHAVSVPCCLAYPAPPCQAFVLFRAVTTTPNPVMSRATIPQQDSVKEYLTSNVTMLKWMIAEGYGDKRTIARRIAKVRAVATLRARDAQLGLVSL
jgi:methionine synthase II (cobalamin-independent)